MGKKSKRREAKSAGAAFCTASYSHAQTHPAFPVPANGWAFELERAERKVKKEGATVDNLLSLCRACRMMRQWDILKVWVALLLSELDVSESISEVKEEALKYKREALKELSVPSLVTDDSLREWFHQIMTKDCSVDKNYFALQIFSNLNCLQYATLAGDVKLLEKIVALGASIDCPPPLRSDSLGPARLQERENVPPDCSALVLVCAMLALEATVGKRTGVRMKKLKQFNKGWKDTLECAIQLVRLGADCDLQLNIPETSTGEADDMLRQIGLNNRSAKELAVLSGNQDLIDTMETFANQENKYMVHCRCGSRLPWKDCHLGCLPIESLSMDNDDGKVCYRYSPLAPCYCTATVKRVHWNCCWESSSPKYQDDRTGQLLGTKIIRAGQPGGLDASAAMSRFLLEGNDVGMVEANYPLLFPEDQKFMLAHEVRTTGLRKIYGTLLDSGKMRDMDSEVYAGTLERLDGAFGWRDDHWFLDKCVIRKRVRLWNAALEKYCNEMNIRGDERIQVMKLHKASPLAPCANVSCNKMETKIKEFMCCSACRSVAFCSRKCQKADWKVHKNICIPR